MRIKNDNIGIAAGRERALARVKAHDLGGIGGDQIDISRQRVAAPHDHLGIHDAKPRLDAGIAAGGVVDAVAERLVFERAAQLVGGDAVDRSLAVALPQRVLIVRRLQRRIGVINLPVRALIVLGRVEQILMQRLAVDRQALRRASAMAATPVPAETCIM